MPTGSAGRVDWDEALRLVDLAEGWADRLLNRGMGKESVGGRAGCFSRRLESNWRPWMAKMSFPKVANGIACVQQCIGDVQRVSELCYIVLQ